MSNYAKFFIALCKLSKILHEDTDSLKKEVVLKYTNGRTDSVTEMTRMEYTSACGYLESCVENDDNSPYKKMAIKKARSIALHQIQLYGIDTTQWSEVNRFCLDPRIAGKPFYKLDGDELEELTRKMRSINKKKELDMAIANNQINNKLN